MICTIAIVDWSDWKIRDTGMTLLVVHDFIAGFSNYLTRLNWGSLVKYHGRETDRMRENVRTYDSINNICVYVEYSRKQCT